MNKKMVVTLASLALCAAPLSCSLGTGEDTTGVNEPTPSGNPSSNNNGADAGGTPAPDASTVAPDAGALSPDAGSGGPDAGVIAADAGTVGPDAGSVDPDAGAVPPDAGTVVLPTSAGWTFYGAQNGLPAAIDGATMDEAGNIWVAGGEEGLFVLEKGATTFRKLTMTDGLRPYGYMPDGSDPQGPKYLNVISVEGGPGSTVFVGYQGRPGCENNWDGPAPDPSIYKSGDADRVTLNAGGTLSVVHYDIFSGPNVVRDEPRGREKVCNVLRMVWDKRTHRVWFGGNHGTAMGFDDFKGNPTCDGQLNCTGVYEHFHPAINAWKDEQKSSAVLLTDAYYGIATDPVGDVWVGGANRTTKFTYVSSGSYWSASTKTEIRTDWSDRFDIWPDAVTEPTFPTPSQRKDDDVSGIAAMSDGGAWIGSWYWGLARINSSGAVTGYRTTSDGLMDNHVYSIATDPADESVWVGAGWGGLTRMQGGQMVEYTDNVFGKDLIQTPVVDIQSAGTGSSRTMLVAFRGGKGKAAAVGVYTGP